MVVGKVFFCNPNNPCVIFVSRYLGDDSPGLSESPTNVPILCRENDIEHSPRFPLNLLPKHHFIDQRSLHQNQSTELHQKVFPRSRSFFRDHLAKGCCKKYFTFSNEARLKGKHLKIKLLLILQESTASSK